MMRNKSLVKRMTYAEADGYCDNHDYHIPSANEAESLSLDSIEYDVFWISETLGGMKMLYHKKIQKYERVHPNIRFNVVLIKD